MHLPEQQLLAIVLIERLISALGVGNGRINLRAANRSLFLPHGCLCKGLWYCTRDIPAARIRRLFGFVELAQAAG